MESSGTHHNKVQSIKRKNITKGGQPQPLVGGAKNLQKDESTKKLSQVLNPNEGEAQAVYPATQMVLQLQK